MKEHSISSDDLRHKIVSSQYRNKQTDFSLLIVEPDINPVTNTYDNSDNESDELIDMVEYNKDTRYLLLTEDTVNDIINNKNAYDFQHKYLADAFRYLRANKISEFRKIVGSNRFIINTKYGKTFLIHEACRLGNPDFVSILLFLGSVCNVLDDNGMMAQHYAVKSKSTVIVDILSLFGNSMNVQDTMGNTPFYYAFNDKNEEMIQTLMIYKADPLIKPINKTPDSTDEDKDLIDMLNGYIDGFN